MDYFFTAFHLAFILFVLLGWAYSRTRKAHVTALLLTIIAWMLMGLYKGVIGYCPLTDWHWQIKRALGETNLPFSFVEYIIEKATRIDFNSALVDGFTVAGLLFGIVMAVINYWADQQAEAAKKNTHQPA